MIWFPTSGQVSAKSTNNFASMLPNPKARLCSWPAAFLYHVASVGDAELLLDVWTTRCCTSRHVSAGLASSTSAKIPAAIGAAAEVPECDDVHPWCKSVVLIDRPRPEE